MHWGDSLSLALAGEPAPLLRKGSLCTAHYTLPFNARFTRPKAGNEVDFSTQIVRALAPLYF